MIVWLERIVWASVSAGITGLIALVLCRLSGLSPLVKLWLCRIASLKFVVTLATGAAVSLTVLPPSSSAVAGESNTKLMVLSAWLFVLWVLGSIVVAQHVIRSQRLAQDLLEASVPASANVCAQVRDLCRRMGVEQPVEILVCKHLSQPCVCASQRPTILIPEKFDAETGHHVMAHEIAHVRHRDLLWGRIQAIVFASFWFHPVLGWLEAEARLWQEAAADAAARKSTLVEPKQQADTIVASLAGLRTLERANVVALGQHGTKETLSRRIRALYENRPSRLAATFAIVFGVAALVPIRLDAIKAPEEPDYADAIAARVSFGGPSDTVTPIATMAR